jgi:protein-disulfide isomerase
MAIAALAPTVAMAQTVSPARPDDRTVGAADAPVTLTVYLSTTCGHCAAWHTTDLPAIKAKYVDTGKLRIVYRDLPTPPEMLAVAGAAMARCAPAERYDDVLHALFAGQTAMKAGPLPGTARTWLAQAGSAGGMTIEQMNACMSDPASRSAVEARGEQASAEGVEFTPAFFVDGKPVLTESPTHDVAAFDAVLQPLLAGR